MHLHFHTQCAVCLSDWPYQKCPRCAKVELHFRKGCPKTQRLFHIRFLEVEVEVENSKLCLHLNCDVASYSQTYLKPWWHRALPLWKTEKWMYWLAKKRDSDVAISIAETWPTAWKHCTCMSVWCLQGQCSKLNLFNGASTVSWGAFCRFWTLENGDQMPNSIYRRHFCTGYRPKPFPSLPDFHQNFH